MKIGIMGGGQLGKMLALAAYPLGIKVICYETDPDCPAALVTDVFIGSYDDQEKLRAFAEQVDVISYEFENIPIAALHYISQINSLPIYPNITALATGQDRLAEKRFFNKMNVPTTQYHAIDSFQDLQHAAENIGLPLILKTRCLGYDGKGQSIIRSNTDMELAWTKYQQHALLAENFIAFEREVSCLAVRGVDGSMVFYPLTENKHRDGILRVSEVLPDHDNLTALAHDYASRILTVLDYVGVLAIEFFQKDGQLYANEMAPRVHNSGHWTIEGAHISQFENHIRAVAGLPLGAANARGRAAMVNFIGQIPELSELLAAIPEVHCHFYGKQPRPGRKLGHASLAMTDEKTYAEQLQQLLRIADV